MNTLVKEDVRNELSFEGFLARYTNSTKAMVQSHIGDFFNWMLLNGYELSRINQSVINLYLDNLRNRGLKNATCNAKISFLKSFFEFHNKTFEFKYEPVKAYTHTKVMNYEGFKKVMEYLKINKEIQTGKRTKFLRDYILFSVLFTTGLRKDEVLSIKHNEVKPLGDKYYISIKTKGNKECVKEIVPSLVQDINKLMGIEGKESNDYVFTSMAHNRNRQNNKLSNKAINKALNHYYQKINKTKEVVTVHSIRNQSGMQYYDAVKGDILAVQDHLGHANVATTEKYLRAVKSQKSDASSILFNLIS